MKDNNSTPLSYGEKEEQKRTISSVCRAWTKRDIVQLTIKDMENFEASKLSSGDTNIEEKKECLSAFEQIMLHAKSDYERLRDGWKPGTPQYESYDLVVRECVKIMTIYSATTPRPVQEKPDKQPLHPVKSLQECKQEAEKALNKNIWRNLERDPMWESIVECWDKAAELYASQFKTPPVQEDQDELWRDVLRGTKKGSMEDIIENWKSKYTIVPK